MIGINAIGADKVAGAFARAAATFPAQTFSLTMHHAELLKTRVIAHSSGRPGPRRIWGDYHRSISVRPGQRGANIEVLVGTNAPQGRRLEFGYVRKTDALGRTYNQPPLPHWGPASALTEPAFLLGISLLIDRI